MIGIIGKLNVEYKVNDCDYVEVFEIGEEEKYVLTGCPECSLFIEEVTYIIDTIYGVSVYFNDDEDDSLYVSENREETFELSEYGVKGKMKIVMF